MIQSAFRPMLGHLQTISPNIRHRLRPYPTPLAKPWRALTTDPEVGDVTITGLLSDPGDTDQLVIIIHGLGGQNTSAYCANSAFAAGEAGFASLRLNLRGADRIGRDFYHAGFVEDVRVALAHPSLGKFSKIALVGYSLGGHIALRSAVRKLDGRVKAAVAVCCPMDLHASQQAIDQPRCWLYRQHIMRGLKAMYRVVAAQRAVPVPVEEVLRAQTMLEMDRLMVVPRFGFRDPLDYYAQASVAPEIGQIDMPSLVITSEHDPVVLSSTILHVLEDAPPCVEVYHLDSGGHVYFPKNLRLHFGPRAGLHGQIMGWVAQRFADFTMGTMGV
jgi:predicted alpha/beta-fold hydrolase